MFHGVGGHGGHNIAHLMMHRQEATGQKADSSGESVGTGKPPGEPPSQQQSGGQFTSGNLVDGATSGFMLQYQQNSLGTGGATDLLTNTAQGETSAFGKADLQNAASTDAANQAGLFSSP